MALSCGPTFVAVLACCVAAVHCVQVSTEVGEIVGFDGTWGGKAVRMFFGIPFAEPPIGDLRFARPVPKAPFEEPFSATKFGNCCVQSDMYLSMFSFNTKWDNFTISEDCLTLNIYVPDGGEAKKPVMVFLHGGGFVTGSGVQYDGSKMAALGDAIVVTINYRLGMLGFFTTLDDAAPGNYGLMDQQLAFKWIQRNIEPFGGDTNRVTIFGESAGAGSVTWHMLVPSNEGLFRRAISQSGTALSSWGLPKAKTVKAYNDMFLKKVNCTDDDSAKVLACLRNASAESLDMYNLMGWPFAHEMAGQVLGGPRSDGDFIPYSPTSRVPKERMEDQTLFRKVELILGSNKYEGSPFLASHFADMYKAHTGRSLFDGIPKHFFELTASGLGGVENKAVVEALWWLYGPGENRNTSDMMDPKQFLDFMGDSMFYVGIDKFLQRRVAEHFGNQGATYMYSFLPMPSKELGGLGWTMKREPWIDGAVHADELCFLFGNATVEKMLDTIGEEEIEMSDTLITYWTNFAKSGNPNQPAPVPFEWPEFANGTDEFIEFDIKDKQVDLRSNSFYRHRYLSFWNDVIPLIENSGQESTVDEVPHVEKEQSTQEFPSDDVPDVEKEQSIAEKDEL